MPVDIGFQKFACQPKARIVNQNIDLVAPALYLFVQAPARAGYAQVLGNECGRDTVNLLQMIGKLPQAAGVLVYQDELILVFRQQVG